MYIHTHLHTETHKQVCLPTCAFTIAKHSVFPVAPLVAIRCSSAVQMPKANCQHFAQPNASKQKRTEAIKTTKNTKTPIKWFEKIPAIKPFAYWVFNSKSKITTNEFQYN